MGKRSNFKRRAQDAYFTPAAGVLPLVPHLPEKFMFDEPCAGDGRLVRHIMDKCPEAGVGTTMDILPKCASVLAGDALKDYAPHPHSELIITNPPWTRQILHPMIDRFRVMRPTWLLFDADWMHTVQAEPYLKFCSMIVSVGRLSWMGNGKHGMDNCAWYRFESDPCETVFNGRAAK